MTTINEKLDKLFPAKCTACQSPFLRVNGYVCKECGLDQHSDEAAQILRYRHDKQD